MSLNLVKSVLFPLSALLCGYAVAEDTGVDGSPLSTQFGQSPIGQSQSAQYQPGHSQLGQTLVRASGGSGDPVLGPTPWVTLLCQYPDTEFQPRTAEEVQTRFGNEPGQLNHYWKAASYNQSSLDGSEVYGWYTMPSLRDSYFLTGEPDTRRLVSDCVKAADADIDFTAYFGINVFTSDRWVSGIGGKGGTMVLNVDGKSLHRFTAMGLNSWSNNAAIVHEMGHGVGLRHSNNSDGDEDPYDNPWTVMSGAFKDAHYSDQSGFLPKHFNAFEKQSLGWFNSSEIFTLDLAELSLGSSQSISIDYINAPFSSHYRMLQLFGGSADYFYTIEAREQSGTYDGRLPGTAIIIHEVDLTTRRSAWIVDADQPPSDVANTTGVMWTPGETFRGEGFDIQIVQRTQSGFEIIVTATNGSVDGNSVPFIRPINEQQTLNAGQLFQLYLHPVDPDGFAPDFSADRLPSGATLSSLSGDTWLFEWTPTLDDLGAVDITFRAMDALDPNLDAAVTVTLTVSESVVIEQGPSNTAVPGRPEHLLGSVPWVTLLCRFSDIPGTQATRAFVQAMFGDAPGQINHWWKTVSYNKTNIDGSLVLGWYDLPKPHSAYVVGDSSAQEINDELLTKDCLSAADDDVDFSRFYGVNTFFNGPFNTHGAGYGVIRSIENDGAGLMATTAIAAPYWTYHTAVNHEMGLAVGLPRSNNSDRDNTTYDSPWSNMSDGRGYAVRDLRYEFLAKHLNAFEKHSLGWLDSSEVLILDVNDESEDGQVLTITLAPMSNQATSNYRAIILTDRTRGPHVYYTIEARDKSRTGLYDQALPGTAVIAHEVNLKRQEPAWVLADLSNTGQVSDYAYTENDMWIVGESLHLPRTRIDVRSRHLDEGFRLSIYTGLDESTPVLTSIGPVVNNDAPAVVVPQTVGSVGDAAAAESGDSDAAIDHDGLGALGLLLPLLTLVFLLIRRLMPSPGW